MPLNQKGREIKQSFEREYGKDKGERYFYASENSGRVKDVVKEGPKKDPKRYGNHHE